MTTSLLEVTDLRTCFTTYRGLLTAVDGVSLRVARGETLALVGESGCGKSMTALSVMRLVPPPGRVVGGEVRLDGEDLLARPARRMRQIRGRRLAMVFQDPLSTLNPTFTVGSQLTEALRAHRLAKGREARERAVELLEAMGLPGPRERMRSYPHELSGGMRQRVAIAAAVSCQPDLLIADEPTTALDVTLQAQIMDLLARVKRERGLAVLLITHDLGLVSRFAERAAVMYAGQIVEQGATETLLAQPWHPYTQGLLRCVPHLGRPELPIRPIQGSIPDMVAPPPGCRFAPRCPEVMKVCQEVAPPTYFPAPERPVRCHLYCAAEVRAG